MEAAVEELHRYHSKDKLKEHVDDENVEDVLERGDYTVEDRLQLRYTLDGLQGTQHTQHTQRLDHAQTAGGALGSRTGVAAKEKGVVSKKKYTRRNI